MIPPRYCFESLSAMASAMFASFRSRVPFEIEQGDEREELQRSNP